MGSTVQIPAGAKYYKLKAGNEHTPYVSDRSFKASIITKKLGWMYFSRGKILFKIRQVHVLKGDEK